MMDCLIVPLANCTVQNLMEGVKRIQHHSENLIFSWQRSHHIELANGFIFTSVEGFLEGRRGSQIISFGPDWLEGLHFFCFVTLLA